MADFPRDPLISRYPARMTAGEARREVRRAGQLRRRVPLGHPYGVAPLWTPYLLAKLIAAIVRRVSGDPAPRRSGSVRRSRRPSR